MSQIAQQFQELSQDPLLRQQHSCQLDIIKNKKKDEYNNKKKLIAYKVSRTQGQMTQIRGLSHNSFLCL